jgi:23S rRNA pseudouridine955/2504/2580 synthase
MRLYTITAADSGKRLDKWLMDTAPGLGKGGAQKALRNKTARVNGKHGEAATRLNEGDEVKLFLPDEVFEPVEKEDSFLKNFRVHLHILYEDENILLADKKPGLMSHPDDRERVNTLLTHIQAYLYQKGEYDSRDKNAFAPALCNRIDRFTGGIVILAKTQEALRTYTALMRDKEAVDKEYLAIVTGRIDAPLTLRDRMVRDERDNRSVLLESRAAENGAQEGDAQDGKWMETIVTPLAAGTEYTLVRVRILTGRTHQIRLHLSEAGHPILGDPKYGDPKKNAKAKEKYGVRGQLLHCAAMRFHDGPLAGKTVECPPPDTFTRIQKALFKEKATGNEGRKKTDR